MTELRTDLPTMVDFQNAGKKGKKALIKYIKSLEIHKYTVRETRNVYVAALAFENVPEMQTYLIPRLRSILYPAEVKKSMEQHQPIKKQEKTQVQSAKEEETKTKKTSQIKCKSSQQPKPEIENASWFSTISKKTTDFISRISKGSRKQQRQVKVKIPASQSPNSSQSQMPSTEFVKEL